MVNYTSFVVQSDRRLGQLLELTRDFGDSLGSYKRAFKQLQGQIPDLDFYVYSNWSTEQILPWNHLQGPLPRSTLIKHLAEATNSELNHK